MKIKLGKKIISKNSPTYFIADIAANHDGNLQRAIKLIRLEKKVVQMQLNFNIMM